MDLLSAIAEMVRLVIHPVWNAYSFFCLYANADGIEATHRTDATGTLDRYVLAKLRQLVEDVQRDMDGYDIAGACATVRLFLDALNNWFIRRSRPRFWKAEQDQDKRDAYDTLYTVLTTLCRVAAPLLPLVTEAIYRGLTNEQSVHLTDWPDAAELPSDPELVAGMDLVRDVSSVALALREERRLRIRLPLARLTVAGAGAGRVEAFAELLRDELNVKEVTTERDLSAFGDFELKLNARALGPRVGKRMKELLAAAKKGDWQRTDAGARVLDLDLEDGEYELRFVPKDGLEESAVAAVPGTEVACILDVRLTPELEREGVARDAVRLIQIARKEAGLHVSDRIRLTIAGNDEAQGAVDAHAAWVQEQTLAEALAFETPTGHVHDAELAGAKVAIGVAKA